MYAPTVPSLRSDPLEELVIPDGTTVEEHDLVASGDIIVGGQTTVEFGVRGRTVIAGERVKFGGHIEAEGDCRLDMWCVVGDNVLVGEDAYLGERVEIDGELKVAGDLDIGDDVDIEDGFEANGWIVIRNPMPTIVFLFIYLSQLLRIGEEEAAEEMLSALVDDGDREYQPVVIPRGASVGDDAWRVSTPARIGNECRLHGNIRAESLVVGRDNEIFGGLRGKDDVTVGSGTEIAGNVTTRNGDVAVGAGAEVRGDVAGEHVEVHTDASVGGEIRARSGTTIVDDQVLDEAVVVEDTVPEPDGDPDEVDDGDPDNGLGDESGEEVRSDQAAEKQAETGEGQVADEGTETERDHEGDEDIVAAVAAEADGDGARDEDGRTADDRRMSDDDGRTADDRRMSDEGGADNRTNGHDEDADVATTD
ncbi:MAG: acyltransferase [Haloarculaceae archaeon]